MRIRYRKVNEHVFESHHEFRHKDNGAVYKTRINMAIPQWMVLDANLEIIAASGANQSYIKAKKEVKKALEALGIEFETETRAKRKIV